MQPSRFDLLTRALAARVTRRQAIIASAGTAATALALPVASHAQATPEPASSVSYLFVQTFGSGAIEPIAGSQSYRLTLNAAPASTIAFADRPARVATALPTDRLPEELGFDPDNPPNAALVTHDDAGETIVLVLELFDPVYDAAAQTVEYRVTELDQYDLLDSSLAARVVPADEMPTSFGVASLFIDDGDGCGDALAYCQSDSDCCSGYVCVMCTITPDDRSETPVSDYQVAFCLPGNV